MGMRQALTAAAVSVLGILVAACGGDTAGTPKAESSSSMSSTSSTSGLPKHGAPSVTKPLDASSLRADPCGALTDQQIKSFPGKFEKTKEFTVDSKSPYCGWLFNNPETGYGGGDISGGLNLENGAKGLSTIYAQHDKGNLTTFKPVGSINGHPAVVYSSGGERPGKCVLALGLSNKRAYIANVSFFEDHPNFQKPCTAAKKLAGYVVENLKARQ